MRELTNIEKYAVSGSDIVYDLDGTCYEYTPFATLDKMIVGAGLIATMGTIIIGRGYLKIPFNQVMSYATLTLAASVGYMVYSAPKHEPQGLCNVQQS